MINKIDKLDKQELEKRIRDEFTKRMEITFKSLILFDKEIDNLLYFKNKKKEQLEMLYEDLRGMELKCESDDYWEKEYHELMKSTFINKFLPRKINELEKEIYEYKKLKYGDEYKFKFPVENEKLSNLISKWNEEVSKKAQKE
ncbi:MAG: hypothetical protein ACRCUM_02050 [Mycoplasmoidaceae bacterium]